MFRCTYMYAGCVTQWLCHNRSTGDMLLAMINEYIDPVIDKWQQNTDTTLIIKGTWHIAFIFSEWVMSAEVFCMIGT